MTRLETKLLGMTLPNPFLLASGPTTANAEKVIEAFEAGWGGAVLKTIGPSPPTPGPKAHVIRTGRMKWGLMDVERASDLSVAQWEGEIDRIRDAFPERPLIASVVGGGEAAEWQEVVRRLEPHGVNGFEINTNFPAFSGDGDRRYRLGQDAKSLALAVGWVRAATELPVMVKLNPNVTDLVPLARAAVEAGADAFTATGGLYGIGGFDFETFAATPVGDGGGLAVDYSGPGLRPVALRFTADIARKLPGVPVVGSGGVAAWDDAAEFFTVGASAVQVGTAAMWDGVGIIDELTAGLTEYLESRGYGSYTEIIGKALPNIAGFNKLDLDYKMLATLIEELCIGCELCVTACEDGGYQAIAMDGDIAKIDLLKCDGCGLCVYVCPPDIMVMKPRDEVVTN